MIDKLEFFIALARAEHFGRAAEECGVSQPSLSAAIRQLEDQLGVVLVVRSARYQGLTPEGQRELESVLSWLELSPDLQVRLIGHASSEGPDDYNQALASRRVEFIVAALTARGFAASIADPLFGDGAESGCQHLGVGRWSCGETQADPSAARPGDRVVRVTFARNSLPPLRFEPLKPPRPLRF